MITIYFALKHANTYSEMLVWKEKKVISIPSSIILWMMNKFFYICELQCLHLEIFEVLVLFLLYPTFNML